METAKIRVRNNGEGAQEAMDEAVKFAGHMGLSEKHILRVRLLVEETLSMVGAITGQFEAEFWIEDIESHGVRLHLQAKTDMDYAKKQELIDVSSSGRNSANLGIMGKIREVIEDSLYGFDEAGRLQVKYGGPSYGMLGMLGAESAPAVSSYVWSLSQYRENLAEGWESGTVEEETWDELEKSIVANLADDVRVAVSGNRVELTIEKRSF